MQYQSPQMNSYSPATNGSSGTYSAHGSLNGGEQFGFKRTNSEDVNRGHDSSNSTPNPRTQRHASFSVDAQKPEYSRPPLQTNVGPYGLIGQPGGNQNYGTQSSPHPFVNQQNLIPMSLPQPAYNTFSSAPSRDSEPGYATSTSSEYPSEGIHHQQSGADLMLLDQMTAPNTMPVFGGEGYNRSPFAIPEDFVAYLFSNQQLENNSPLNQVGQQGYAK